MTAIDTLREALFGNPQIEGHRPSQSGTLAAFIELNNRVSSMTLGVETFDRVADLPSVSASDKGRQARVTNDSTASNNTFWIVNSSGSWVVDNDFVSAISAGISADIDATRAAANAATSAANTATTAANAATSAANTATTTATAAASAASTASTNAAEALDEAEAAYSLANDAGVMAGMLSDQGNFRLRTEREHPSYQYGNTAIKSQPQSDGTRTTPFWEHYDFEIPAGSDDLRLTFLERLVSGAMTVTIEERSASAQIVAPVTVALNANSEYRRTWSPHANTTIIRVKNEEVTEGFYHPPSLTVDGTPTSVPNDPQYVASLLKTIGDDDSLMLGRIVEIEKNNGDLGEIIDMRTFTVPANSRNWVTYLFDHDVPKEGKITVLGTVQGMKNSPRELFLRLRNVRGEQTSDIPIIDRWDRPGTFYIVVDAMHNGWPVSGLQLQCRTANGGEQNNPDPEDVTITFDAYASGCVPKIRTVPVIVTQQIEKKIAENRADQLNEIDELVERRIVEMLGSQRLSGLISNMVDALTYIDLFVDPKNGDDTNVGSHSLPLKNWHTAVSRLALTGGTVGLKRSVFGDLETHHYNSSTGVVNVGWNDTTGVNSPDVNLVAYGPGKERAVLDARQSLAGATWTQMGSSNMWQTTVTHREATTDNTSTINADTTHYMMWLGTEKLEWKWNAADQNAMLNAVLATPGSWAVQVSGQTDPDPRQASVNGADHRYIVHMPDGSDPNGADLYIADLNIAVEFFGGSHRDLHIFGCHGKDNFHSRKEKYTATGRFAIFDSFKMTDIPAHGFVGPVDELRGRWEAEGRPIEGFSGGFNGGGCLNFYTSTDYPDHDIRLQEDFSFRCKGFSKALYAHGSGNHCYRSVKAHPNAVFEISDCNEAVAFDSISALVVDEVEIYNLFMDGVETVARGGVGTLTIDGFEIKFGAPTHSSRMRIATPADTGDIHLKNGRWSFTSEETPTSRPNYLITCDGNLASTVRFENCVDETVITESLRKGAIFDSMEARLTVEIINSQLGDLTGSQSNRPAFGALTVDSNSTFGLSNMTKSEIEAADPDYSVEAGARIVNLAGRLIEVAS